MRVDSTFDELYRVGSFFCILDFTGQGTPGHQADHILARGHVLIHQKGENIELTGIFQSYGFVFYVYQLLFEFSDRSSSDDSAIFTSAGRVLGSGRKNQKKNDFAHRLGSKLGAESPKSLVKNAKGQKNKKKKVSAALLLFISDCSKFLKVTDVYLGS